MLSIILNSKTVANFHVGTTFAIHQAIRAPGLLWGGVLNLHTIKARHLLYP